jgi:hypothetical protein
VIVQDILSAAFLSNYEVQVSQNIFTKEQDFKLPSLRTVSITNGKQHIRCYHDSFCSGDNERNTEFFHENQSGHGGNVSIN